MAFKVSYNIVAIDNFSKVLKKLERDFQNLNKKLTGSGGALNNITGGMASLSQNIAQAGKKANKAKSELAGMSNSIQTRNASGFNRWLGNIGNNAAVVGGKIKQAFGHIVPPDMAGFGKHLAVAASVGYGIKEASDLQVEQIRLAPYVGGMKEAENKLNQLREMSIKTGVSITDLASGFHSLVDVGMPANKAMAQLKEQLDITKFGGGNIAEVADITGRVIASGKATEETFDMLRRRHINLRAELAKKIGVDFDTFSGKQAVNNFISQGLVTKKLYFELLKVRMEHEKISGISEKITSDTVTGNIASIWNSIKDSLTSVGQMLSPALVVVLKGIAWAFSWIATILRKLAALHSWVVDTFAWGAVLGAIFLKFKMLRKIITNIFSKFSFGKTILESFEKTARLIVSPFIKVFNFVKGIFGFLFKVVKMAAGLGFKGAKGAVEAVAKSPVAKKVGTSIAGAAAANPIVDAASLLIMPSNLGDATRHLPKNGDVVKGLLKPDTYTMTQSEDGIPSFAGASQINTGNNINKSHVKIEFEPKGANINSVRQKDDTKNTFFDLSSLGLNVARG